MRDQSARHFYNGHDNEIENPLTIKVDCLKIPLILLNGSIRVLHFRSSLTMLVVVYVC